jgi:hypothetical protein
MPDSALNPPTAWRTNAKDGADTSCRAIGAVDYHPFSVRCFAPAITRLQRAVAPASTLAHLPADDRTKQMTLRSDAGADLLITVVKALG